MWNWFQTDLWISPMHFSTRTHLQILMYIQRKRNQREKQKKKNFKMVVKLVSNRPLEDLPFPQCTSQHSPIFKYSYKEKEIIDLKKKWFRTWLQRDLWISHLADALLSTHPSSNSYVPLDRGVSISASIKKNLIFVRNNNKTSKYFLFLRVCIFSYLDIFHDD